MLARGVAYPDQLVILTHAVDDFCILHRIVSKEDRERVAVKVMVLFGRGMIDPVQLSAELEKSPVWIRRM